MAGRALRVGINRLHSKRMTVKKICRRFSCVRMIILRAEKKATFIQVELFKTECRRVLAFVCRA